VGGLNTVTTTFKALLEDFAKRSGGAKVTSRKTKMQVELLQTVGNE